MTSLALASAAVLTVGIGIAHSWLGERRLICPLLAPAQRQGVLSHAFARRVLRFAWHITTLAWWGLAAILLVLATTPSGPQSRVIVLVIAAIFLASGLLTLITSRGRHLAWPVFLLIAVLATEPVWPGLR